MKCKTLSVQLSMNVDPYLTVSGGLGACMKCEVVNVPPPDMGPKLCCRH